MAPILTDQSRKEVGNVDDICGITGSIVVHLVRLAALVAYNVKEDVDS